MPIALFGKDSQQEHIGNSRIDESRIDETEQREAVRKADYKEAPAMWMEGGSRGLSLIDIQIISILAKQVKACSGRNKLMIGPFI